MHHTLLTLALPPPHHTASRALPPLTRLSATIVERSSEMVTGVPHFSSDHGHRLTHRFSGDRFSGDRGRHCCRCMRRYVCVNQMVIQQSVTQIMELKATVKFIPSQMQHFFPCNACAASCTHARARPMYQASPRPLPHNHARRALPPPVYTLCSRLTALYTTLCSSTSSTGSATVSQLPSQIAEGFIAVSPSRLWRSNWHTYWDAATSR